MFCVEEDSNLSIWQEKLRNPNTWRYGKPQRQLKHQAISWIFMNQQFKWIFMEGPVNGGVFLFFFCWVEHFLFLCLKHTFWCPVTQYSKLRRCSRVMAGPRCCPGSSWMGNGPIAPESGRTWLENQRLDRKHLEPYFWAEKFWEMMISCDLTRNDLSRARKHTYHPEVAFCRAFHRLCAKRSQCFTRWSSDWGWNWRMGSGWSVDLPNISKNLEGKWWLVLRCCHFTHSLIVLSTKFAFRNGSRGFFRLFRAPQKHIDSI